MGLNIYDAGENNCHKNNRNRKKVGRICKKSRTLFHASNQEISVFGEWVSESAFVWVSGGSWIGGVCVCL